MSIFWSVITSCFALMFASSSVAFESPQAEPITSSSASKEEINDLDLTVLTLKNGMKVCLKRTGSDEEIRVRLTALGGFASLPPTKRAAGKYASQVAIRSGIGQFSFDQLQALFYDRSIDFTADVQPFSRYIEGTAYMREIETILNLVNLFFVGSHLEENAFKKVMEKAKEQILQRSKNSSRIFEDAYIAFNTQNFPSLEPLTVQEIEHTNFILAKNFFDAAFKDPSEFVCVIAGSFDTDKMIDLINKYLAVIPPSTESKGLCAIPPVNLSPQGIRSKILRKPVYRDTESITRLAFPVGAKVTRENYIHIENLTYLIHLRLKNVLRERYGQDLVVIDVSTEYPFYPSTYSPWIKIQYHAEPKLVASMGQAILSELTTIQKDAFTEEEIATMKRKYQHALREREKENDYWIVTFSNYALWNCDMKEIQKDLLPITDRELVKQKLQTLFSTDNYSAITYQ